VKTVERFSNIATNGRSYIYKRHNFSPKLLRNNSPHVRPLLELRQHQSAEINAKIIMDHRTNSPTRRSREHTFDSIGLLVVGAVFVIWLWPRDIIYLPLASLNVDLIMSASLSVLAGLITVGLFMKLRRYWPFR